MRRYRSYRFLVYRRRIVRARFFFCFWRYSVVRYRDAGS